MQDSEARAALRDVTYDNRDGSALFAEIREIGREFEAGLDALLFSSRLAPLTRAYAIF